MQVKQHHWSQVTGWDFSSEAAPEKVILEKAQLILIFGSLAALQEQASLAALRHLYPAAHFLGCSTAGDIFQMQVIDEGLIATAIQFEHTPIRGYEIQLAPDEESFAAGDRLGQRIDPEGLTHVFVLSDGLQVNGSELVRGLVQHLPSNVTITGGLAGDGDRFQQTCVLWDAAPESG